MELDAEIKEIVKEKKKKASDDEKGDSIEMAITDIAEELYGAFETKDKKAFVQGLVDLVGVMKA